MQDVHGSVQARTSEDASKRPVSELEQVNAEMQSLGFPGIFDLHNLRINYHKAIPPLIRWLEVATEFQVKDGVISALASPCARPMAASALARAYIQETGPGQRFEKLRWELCNALDYTADDSVADELIQIALETRHGRDRNMGVAALGRLKDPRAVDVLIRLLEDRDVRLGSLRGLARLAPVEAIQPLLPLLKDRDAEIRKDARRALKTIQRKHPELHLEIPQAGPPPFHRVSAKERPPASCRETSTSGDLEDLPYYVRPLKEMTTGGFDETEVLELMGWLESCPKRGSARFRFPVTYRGEEISLLIGLRFDEDEVLFYMWAPPEFMNDYEPRFQAVLEELEQTELQAQDGSA